MSGLAAAVVLCLVAACSDDGNDLIGRSSGSCAGPDGRCIVIAPTDNDLETILAALIEAKPGDVIYLREGLYEVDGQLSLDVDGVTIRGEGMDKTILSFKNQSVGGEGLLVVASDFRIEDLALEDSGGDLLRVLGAERLFIRRVRAEWTNGPSEDNGAYGLYPIQCRDVVIEDSVVKGASDAGIYVGQSKNIILRRNRVEFNVAGIEIENSQDADVYENVATNNTGGILVFNLPGLPVKDGRRTRVFRNQSFANNTPNFAPPGNIVGGVPTGTGLMILANDDVEVFDNEFRDNGTFAVLSVSFNTARLIGGFQANDPAFDPYSEGIFVHDNTYIGGGENPDPDTADLIRSLVPSLGDGPMPQVFFDGDLNPARFVDGSLPDPLRHCVQEEAGVTFADLDIDGGFQNPTTDVGTVDCTHPPLGEIAIEGADDSEPGPPPDDLTPVQPPTGEVTVENRCTPAEGSGPWFDPDDTACNLLSSYRFFRGDGSTQEPNEGVTPYDLNTALFSDYADKHRFVYLPPGTSASYDPNGSFEFPVGSVVIKTFAFPEDARNRAGEQDLVETRLLVRRADRWIGVTYLWNEEETEAYLKITGAAVPVAWVEEDGTARATTFNVPNANQCKACHSEMDGVVSLLGTKARNLNKDYAYADGVENQLTHWSRIGILSGAPDASSAPRAPAFDDPSTGDVESRARTYLDVNCGNCHNERGLARPSGLYLTIDEDDPTALGICKSPAAAGRGSGGFSYDIEPGAPERSIVLFRMTSIEPGIAMPELGRQLVHEEAIGVLSDWIASIPGSCD
jgi:parallel beta-helix repeat protein